MKIKLPKIGIKKLFNLFIEKNDICDECHIEMDAFAYNLSASLFYYKCSKCKKENHRQY